MKIRDAKKSSTSFPRKRESIWLFILLITAALLGCYVLKITGGSIKFLKGGAFSGNTLARNALQDEGRRLKKAGMLDEALLKYRAALDPAMLNFEWQASTARGAIIQIYCIQGKYKEALNDLDWFLLGNRDKFTPWLNEIKSLAEYQSSGNAKTIYDYISWLREAKKKFSPPVYVDDQTVSTILRLYNTIGDHDAGIRFINEILNWTFESDTEFKHLKGIVQTAEQATQCSKFDAKPGSDWRACKWLREYLLVREAFEQDKADGFKGCAHSPPGQVCMGKATKALIQSFPW